MTNYKCIDDYGNKTIVVSWNMMTARSQAERIYKKNYNSSLVSIEADYSNIN